MRAHGEKTARRMDHGVFHERRFLGAARGKRERPCVAMRLERHGERAANRAQVAGERELAGELVSRCRRHRKLSRGDENAERDGQIEASRFLGQIGRRQVDGDFARRKFEMRVLQRCAHAIAALLHCGFGQADKVESGQSA